MRTSSMHRPLPVVAAKPLSAHEEESREPEQHVDQINPNSMLHPDLARLLRRRVSGDVNLAEDAKKSRPEDTIAAPKPVS